MNLADLFTNDPWAEFDALPLPMQKLEIHYMQKQCELYSKRYQKNSGSLGGASKKHSEETIQFIIEEMEKIRIQNKKKSDASAYIALVEKVLANPETEKLFIENEWLSKYKSKRKEEIRRIAKQFQQAVYRHTKKLSGT